MYNLPCNGMLQGHDPLIIENKKREADKHGQKVVSSHFDNSHTMEKRSFPSTALYK